MLEQIKRKLAHILGRENQPKQGKQEEKQRTHWTNQNDEWLFKMLNEMNK